MQNCQSRDNFENHPMNMDERSFLVPEIKNIVASGCVRECEREDLPVINPLKVAKNKENMRMILDLQYINKHLRSCRLTYEDLHTVINLLEKDGYFFKWDYKSGYPHIDILQEHQKYLGFSMEIESQVSFLHSQSYHLACLQALTFLRKYRNH